MATARWPSQGVEGSRRQVKWHFQSSNNQNVGIDSAIPRIPPMRPPSRRPDELRPLTFRRRYTRQAPGSVLVRMGRTTVLCTCCVEAAVPPFLAGRGKGWLTAEYGMRPGSTNTRKPRDRSGKIDGRGVEI